MGLTIKEKIEHAMKFGYPVRVAFKGFARKGLVIKTEVASFVMSVCEGMWHHYAAVLSVEDVDEGEEVQDEPVAIGQFVYIEPGAGRKVVGLICDSVLVNSEGKLVVHAYWLGRDHIAGMAGRLDMDFARSIFGYHGGATVYDAVICGGYADITFTIDDSDSARRWVGKSSPHCAASGCKHRSEEWPVCDDKDCNGRYIFVTHDASVYADDAGATPDPSEPER